MLYVFGQFLLWLKFRMVDFVTIYNDINYIQFI